MMDMNTRTMSSRSNTKCRHSRGFGSTKNIYNHSVDNACVHNFSKAASQIPPLTMYWPTKTSQQNEWNCVADRPIVKTIFHSYVHQKFRLKAQALPKTPTENSTATNTTIYCPINRTPGFNIISAQSVNNWDSFGPSPTWVLVLMSQTRLFSCLSTRKSKRRRWQ